MKNTKSRTFHTIIVYLCTSAFMFVFNIIYAQHSHGVSSFRMTWLWLWILGLGAAVYLPIWLCRSNIENHPLFRLFCNLYNSGVAILGNGMLLRGIFDIATTSSGYVYLFYILSYAFFSAAGITFILICKRKNGFKIV